MTGVNNPVPRRERLRLATIDEIKQVAREQLGKHGPAGVSLRAVARAMGMTPSALYRYFDSRDALIEELATDAFRSLADALEAGFDAAPPGDHAARWLGLTRAYRRWALEHAVEYTLIFASPASPHMDMKSSAAEEHMHRSIAVLFRCMAVGIAEGALDPSDYARQLSPELRAKLEAWREATDVPFSVEGLAACLVCWTQLHGFLTLELFGHLPPPLGDVSDLFDQQMLDLLIRIGHRAPVTFPATAADLSETADSADSAETAETAGLPAPAAPG
jgi:AcrR family transcriptional regulator